MNSKVSILIVVLSVSSRANGRQWSPATFPNPTDAQGARACGRGDSLGFLCDPESYLSTESSDVVEGHLKQIDDAEYPYGSSGCHEKDASYSPGFQVGVAILSSIKKESGEGVAEAAERFAEAIFDSWGIGHEDCGNGVLLLLAVEDRQVYIAVGSKIEQFASKKRLQIVINNMKPELRVKNYQYAVEQAVVDLGLLLAGADPSPPHDSDESSPWGLVVFLAIIGGVGALIFGTNRRQRRQQREAASLLEKLQREQETAKLTGKYPAASCPICFEDLQPVNREVPSAPAAENVDASAPPLDTMPQAERDTVLDEKETKQPLLSRRRSREKVAQESVEGACTSGQQCSEEQDSRKKPLCLPCGHTFCTPCISEWLQRSTKCPICRTNVGSVETVESTQRGLSTRSNWELDYNDSLYRNEMAFRMARLQRMYPSQVPQQIVDTGRGDWIDFSSMRQQMMQSQTRSTFSNSGHTGISDSFGGGHSSGGVGGGW